MFTIQAIHLGPIMIPWGLVIPLTALLFSLVLGRYLTDKFQVSLVQWRNFKDSIWTAILIGLLLARISFVLFNLDSYLSHPIEIFKIQDKGFHLLSAIISTMIWIFWKNRALAKSFLCLLLLFFSALSTTGFAVLHQAQIQYQQYPQLKLQRLEQQVVALNHFIGKPTVINLWASWCPPCHREMPVLQHAQSVHKDVHFVFINQGENSATVQQYINLHAKGLDNVLLDPQGLTAQTTGMFGLPSTLFFNAQGKLVSTHMGELTHASLNQKLKQIQSN